MPDYTKIRKIVESRIKPERFLHSLGVEEVAVSLASRYCVSIQDAKVAAIYHDAYRYSGNEDSIALLEKAGYIVFPEERKNPMLLHGALAALHFDEDAGEAVPAEMKAAVRHHTLGHRTMGVLGAIIYIADYTEKGRKHLDNDDRKEIFSHTFLEDMVVDIIERERSYFNLSGIKEAEVTRELYDFLKEGGKL